MSLAPHRRIAIIGSGFAGLGAAIRLRQAGHTEFVILERATAVGGVWRDNRYPGCACDVESHLFQYSFAPNPDWTERFASGPEIWRYLERCASDFGLRPHLEFGCDVTGARWDESARQWHLTTSRGTMTANILVSAVGALSAPNVPRLPGLNEFQGPIFHSAKWDRGFDPTGQRIAVVGSGASAVQIVPALQPQAAQLILFQRTAAWVVPRMNRPISEERRAWLRRSPLAARLTRGLIRRYREVLGLGFRHPWAMRPTAAIARWHLRRSVRDPLLRAKLTPNFAIGCKRILVSDDYYPALEQPNVEVVAGPVTGVTLTGLIGLDQAERSVNAVVFCTGFEVTDFPFSHVIVGRGGQTLAASWRGSPKAHLGTTVNGFPNLFLLQGPNTGLGHTSVILMQEAQCDHLLAALAHLDRNRLATLEPTEAAQTAFVAEVDQRLAKTVWLRGGCQSWYLDRTGRNSTLWPGTPGEFHRRAAGFRPGEYLATP